jgi:carbon-monoxide dehydrogenase large subunit
MNDGATLRIHPTGKAQLGISVQTQGQGHETTFAQIVGEELGIPPEDIDVVHGDTDTTPYGLGTYGSALDAGERRGDRRSSRARCASGADRRLGDARGRARRPRMVSSGRWSVKGDPEKGATIQEIAMAARGAIELPEGVEAGLDAEAVYDPPNLTFPFGAYVCVVDVDPGPRS